MNLHNFYNKGNTYREKYNIALGLEKEFELKIKKLELKKELYKVVIVILSVSSFILALSISTTFLIGIVAGLIMQIGTVVYFGGQVGAYESLIRQVRSDQSFYASLHNMEADIKNDRSSNESYTSSFSYSYDSRENEQRGTFKKCVTVADVKKVYRAKAKKHHPDVGGDEETFRTLVVQYERALTIAQSA